MVTYSDLIQFCLLLVTLVGLCYTIFRREKIVPFFRRQVMAEKHLTGSFIKAISMY